MSDFKASLVFSHAVMLPLIPLGDLDLGIVRCSETKVRVNDNFIHLEQEREIIMVPTEQKEKLR